MNCAEGEWWDAFAEMWGDIFGRTDEFEAERNDCTLEEWRALMNCDEVKYIALVTESEA